MRGTDSGRAHGALMALLLVGAAIPVQAYAQDTSASTTQDVGPVLEEVVVTAQRRVENVQDVPATVTALSGEQLEAAGVGSTKDLTYVTPGLLWGRSTSFSQPTIRGIGSRGGTGDESNVATYVDGVYQAESFGTIFELANVERIEVLKGPQGSLYGRNATGGAVIVTTTAPSFKPEARVSATYGDFNYTKLSGYVSGPLWGDKLAGSLSGVRVNDDGFVKNVFTGATQGKSSNNTLRGRLLFVPTDKMEFQLNAFTSNMKNTITLSLQPYYGNSAARSPANTLGIPLAIRVPTGKYQTATEFEPPINTRVSGADVQFKYDFGPATLRMIASGQDTRVYSNQDLEFSPLPLSYYEYEVSGRGYNQDVTLTSNGEGRFTWIVGASAFQYKGFSPANTGGFYFTGTAKTQSVSAFAEATWEVIDRLFVTGGVRYSKDTKKASYQPTTPAGAPKAGGTHGEDSWDQVSPRVAIRYEISPSTNVYASYTTGYKSGTFNAVSALGASIPAEPETVKGYEVGFKSDISRSLRLNGSAFSYDYKDLQTTVTVTLPAGNAASILQNAPGAKIRGAELGLDWAATDRLTFSGGASWLDAKFEEFPNATVTDYRRDANGNPTLTGNTTQPRDVTGNRLIRSPEFTANITANYTADLLGGDLDTSVSWFTSGKYYLDLLNRLNQPAYNFVSASVRWTAPDGRFNVMVSGQNLTDEHIVQSMLSTNNGDFFSFQKPRWFSVTLGYNF